MENGNLGVISVTGQGRWEAQDSEQSGVGQGFLSREGLRNMGIARAREQLA